MQRTGRLLPRRALRPATHYGRTVYAAGVAEALGATSDIDGEAVGSLDLGAHDKAKGQAKRQQVPTARTGAPAPVSRALEESPGRVAWPTTGALGGQTAGILGGRFRTPHFPEQQWLSDQDLNLD